ncbi:Acyl-CoA dehydrogenase [bacterium HR30]|nr:Acyl-CoA dehydrogenase [bacterium HR30]
MAAIRQFPADISRAAQFSVLGTTKGPFGEEVRDLAGVVASRLLSRWNGTVDKNPPNLDLVRDFDEECTRAGLAQLFSEASDGGEGSESLAASAIRGFAEADGGIAAIFLARLAAVLPWVQGSVEVPVVDGWSTAWSGGSRPDVVWAWGWRDGLPITVCVPGEGSAWRLQLLPAQHLGSVEVHQRMGLRACPSAWVRVHLGEPMASIEVGRETIARWRSLVAGWWAVIALARGRAALSEAVRYASVRYQGGALLIEHPLVQEMLGRAFEAVVAAEALLTRGFSGDASSLAAGTSLATQASERAAHTAQQVFGGYGYMRDYPVERCLRDVKMAAVAAGGSARLRVATAHAVCAAEGVHLPDKGEGVSLGSAG